MTRVLVADDDAMVRGGLAAMLDAQPDLEVVGEAVDGVDAVATARDTRPDVVVMDVRMPRLDGIGATRQIVADDSPPAVLVVTTFEHDSYALDALRAGAAGFLLKRSGADLLVQAVRTLALGDAVLFPARIRDLVDRFGGGVELPALAPREQEVLRGLARGMSNAEIAAELFLGVETVKTYVASLLAKLGCATAPRRWWRRTSPGSCGPASPTDLRQPRGAAAVERRPVVADHRVDLVGRPPGGLDQLRRVTEFDRVVGEFVLVVDEDLAGEPFDDVEVDVLQRGPQPVALGGPARRGGDVDVRPGPQLPGRIGRVERRGPPGAVRQQSYGVAGGHDFDAGTGEGGAGRHTEPDADLVDTEQRVALLPVLAAVVLAEVEVHRGADRGVAREGRHRLLSHVCQRNQPGRGESPPRGRRTWHTQGVLRTHRIPNVVPQSGFDAALRLCATRPDVHVFVAARLLAGGRHAVQNLVTLHPADDLRSMCWTSANVVPVEVADDEIDLYAARLRRFRRRSSSIFGRSEQVLPLWDRLERHWGTARTVRWEQPVMSMTVADLSPDVPVDDRVRPARPDEVDLVLPAAAHMFTGEIGYPPFYGSDREYRRLVASLINRGHTYVMVQSGRVVFKADIGSLAFGVAQIQGVWVAPELRGHGLATPAMHSVVRQVLDHHAHTVSLYVNDFNTAAVRTYQRCGFRQVDTFSTVIL